MHVVERLKETYIKLPNIIIKKYHKSQRQSQVIELFVCNGNNVIHFHYWPN